MCEPRKMKIEKQHPSFVSAPAVVRHDGVAHRPWRLWALLASALFLVAPAVYAAPNVTAALEPAEIRPGAFTTFTITIENGVPDGAPKLKLPEELELTTSDPAYEQQ